MIMLSGSQKNTKVGEMQSFPGNSRHQKHYKVHGTKPTKQTLDQPESTFCLRNQGECEFINCSKNKAWCHFQHSSEMFVEL